MGMEQTRERIKRIREEKMGKEKLEKKYLRGGTNNTLESKEKKKKEEKGGTKGYVKEEEKKKRKRKVIQVFL